MKRGISITKSEMARICHYRPESKEYFMFQLDNNLRFDNFRRYVKGLVRRIHISGMHNTLFIFEAGGGKSSLVVDIEEEAQNKEYDENNQTISEILGGKDECVQHIYRLLSYEWRKYRPKL